MKIDFNALAEFASMNFDCSEVFEDDAFTVDFDGERFYVERKRNHFAIHVGDAVHKLPRD